MKVIMCNCPKEFSQEIAKTLVAKKLAACVNIIPNAKSYYIWNDEYCEDIEDILIIKTKNISFSKIEKEILKIHPNDIAEIIELSISDMHIPYLNWAHT